MSKTKDITQYEVEVRRTSYLRFGFGSDQIEEGDTPELAAEELMESYSPGWWEVWDEDIEVREVG